MNTRATVRRNEAVFCTVDGAKFDGNEYAGATLVKMKGRGFPTTTIFPFSVYPRFSQRHRLLKE